MRSQLVVIFIWMFVSVIASKLHTELNSGGDVELDSRSVRPHYHHRHHHHHHPPPSSGVIWSAFEEAAADHFNDYYSKRSRRNHEDNSQRLANTTPVIQLGTVLKALRRALVFFKLNYQDLNLDAVIGTRMAEGQLKVLAGRLADESSTLKLPSVVDLKEIYELTLLAHKVCETTIPVVKKTETRYFNDLGRLLERGFWELDYPTRKTNPNLVNSVVAADEVLDENNSDECLMELLGSGKSKRHSCSVTDECWRRMSVSHSSRYSLIHQVLYLQVGEMMGCADVMKTYARRYNHDTISSMQEKYCSNVLREMQENVAEGFPERKQDLFMEQAAICGIYGYSDLFTMDWLIAILSWEKPEGCYGTLDRPHVRYESRQVKREEKVLDGECLAHKTTVAIAALTLYVRYLVEDPLLSGGTLASDVILD